MGESSAVAVITDVHQSTDDTACQQPAVTSTMGAVQTDRTAPDVTGAHLSIQRHRATLSAARKELICGQRTLRTADVLTYYECHRRSYLEGSLL